MHKLMMLVLSFTLLTTIAFTNKDSFMNEIQKGYAFYEVVSDVETDDYSICIVRGVNKNKSSMGVFFNSACEDEYYCVIYDGSKEYKLSAKENGDVYYPAISYSIDLEVKIYDCDNNLYFRKVVQKVNTKTFSGTAGANKGIIFNSPKNFGGISSSLVIFYIIAISVIGLCAIIIIIFKVSKRGMFDEQKRSEVARELKALEDEYVNKDLHQEDNIYNVNETDYKEEKTEEVYEKNHYYDDELDEARPDVKLILKSRGFNTDYANMEVEDKNRVMVELMMMREQLVINNEEYQHEIIELWKK